MTENQFLDNVTTIRTNRYGSEIRRAIYENFEYLKENGGGGGGGLSFVSCTQEEYNSMDTHDPTTLYIIIEEES